MSNMPQETNGLDDVKADLPPFHAVYEDFWMVEQAQGYDAAVAWLNGLSIPERGKNLVMKRVVEVNFDRMARRGELDPRLGHIHSRRLG